MCRQRCSLDVYCAPLFTREPLHSLTHRAEPLWSRDDTIMSYPWRAQGAEHASYRANHLHRGPSWLNLILEHVYLSSLLMLTWVRADPGYIARFLKSASSENRLAWRCLKA